MKPEDLKDAFSPAPKAFHEALTRSATRPQTPRARSGRRLRPAALLAAALALVCFSAAAVAATIGFDDFIARGWSLLGGPEVRPSDVDAHELTIESQSCTLETVEAEITQAMWLGGQLHFTVRVTAADPERDALLYAMEVGTDGERADWVFPGGEEAGAMPIDEWTPQGKRALLCSDGYRISALAPGDDQTPLYTWETSWIRQGDAFVLRVSTGVMGEEAYDWQALTHEDGLLHLAFGLYTEYWQGELAEGTLDFAVRPPTAEEMESYAREEDL